MRIDLRDPFWQAEIAACRARHTFAREMVRAINRQVRDGMRRTPWPTTEPPGGDKESER